MDNSNNKLLLDEIAELRHQLFEANNVIDAIREGSVDALVLNKDGQPHVYSIESADYTYRVLIEKFGEGALSISEEGLILYCNDYFAKLVGISANKITGTFLQSYVDSVRDFQLLKVALAEGPSKGEILLNGGDRKIHVYMSLTDLQPKVPAIGVVVTDLSEKRRHEEALISHQLQLETKVNELHQTNANLEQFIHVISHDLKEPIRKLIAYTSNLSASETGISETDRNNLKIIKSSSFRLNSLVDDLVRYAFMATKAEESKVDLAIILAEVLEDLELTINEYNARIEIHDLPVVLGSKVQMRQLFSNLIGNAIKYSKKDVAPLIKISGHQIREDGKTYQKVQVADNGIGISDIYFSKIFTIFQRLHMRDEYSGNGIGLSICRKIMENHGGKIDVESSEEGSIFSLYFPTKYF